MALQYIKNPSTGYIEIPIDVMKKVKMIKVYHGESD